MTTSSTATSPSQRLVVFDECIGKPYLDRLRTLVVGVAAFDASIEHILDFQREGVWDEVWVPQIATRGGVIVSQDRGKGGIKKGEPLPRVCLRHGVTHVLLSARAGSLKMPDKLLAILSVWKEIIGLFDLPRGRRFQLELRPGVQNHGRLVDKTPDNAIIGPANHQNLLTFPD